MQARLGPRSHTQYLGEPLVVKSHSPREEATLQHPLKTAYSAGAWHIHNSLQLVLEP